MLFGGNFHVLGLFRKFEIGRKIVKNHGLTPLLFGEIFDLKITAKLHPKMSEISRKRKHVVETFLRGYLGYFEISQKVSKKHALLLLHFGEISYLQVLAEFFPKITPISAHRKHFVKIFL